MASSSSCISSSAGGSDGHHDDAGLWVDHQADAAQFGATDLSASSHMDAQGTINSTRNPQQQFRHLCQQRVYERAANGNFKACRRPRPPGTELLLDIRYVEENIGYGGCVDYRKLVWALGLQGHTVGRMFVQTGESQYAAPEQALCKLGFRPLGWITHTAEEIKGFETSLANVLTNIFSTPKRCKDLVFVGHFHYVAEHLRDRFQQVNVSFPHFMASDLAPLQFVRGDRPWLVEYDIWELPKVKEIFVSQLKPQQRMFQAGDEALNQWLHKRPNEKPPVPSSTHTSPASSLAPLPIQQYKEELLHHLSKSRVLIINGHTGCGKSTQVPQYILKAAKGQVKIVVTQPRRLAVISLWQRVREELGADGDRLAGFAIGGKHHNFDAGRIVFCTTGVLLVHLRQDPSLQGFTHVICDEVHERTMDGDLLLSWLRRCLQEVSSTTKVLVMSATLTVSQLQTYFTQILPPSEVSLLSINGNRLHPVTEVYLDDIMSMLQQAVLEGLHVSRTDCLTLDGMKQVMDVSCMAGCFNFARQSLGYELLLYLHHQRPTEQAILVFLPGLTSILDYYDLLMTEENLDLHILHSEQRLEEQSRALDPSPLGTRKVILSTNIAESSLTVPDVDIVIDFCCCKEMRWRPEFHIESLEEEWCSQGSATQRAGRTGRVRPGTVYRIIPKEKYCQLCPLTREAEMQRMPLAPQLLRALQLGAFGDIWYDVFQEAMDPPGNDMMSQARTLLLDLKCVVSDPDAPSPGSASDVITSRGRLLNALPLSLGPGMLILYGIMFDCPLLAASAASVIAAAQFPITGPSLRDVIIEGKARWGYAGHWESDIIAGVAAHLAFRRQRNAEGGLLVRDEQRRRLKAFCVQKCLNFSALLDIDQLFGRLVACLQRCGFLTIQKNVITSKLSEQFDNADHRLLLGMLVNAAFSRNLLKVQGAACSSTANEMTYLKATFSGTYPSPKVFVDYLEKLGIGHVDRTFTTFGDANVNVTFRPPAKREDAWPLYLCSKLRPTNSSIPRASPSFSKFTSDVKGDVSAVFGNIRAVNLDRRSVVCPVIVDPMVREDEMDLAGVACKMYLTQTNHLSASQISLLPRSLPGLWRLLLITFASQVTDNATQAEVQLEGAVWPMDIKVNTWKLHDTISQAQAKVQVLRNYVQGFLCEAIGDLSWSEDDADGLDDHSEILGLHDDDPVSQPPPMALNGWPSPQTAAECLLSLAKELYDAKCVPKFAHFARWQQEPSVAEQLEDLLGEPAYECGHSLKPFDEVIQNEKVWHDIWVAPPTPSQVTAFEPFIRDTGPEASSLPEDGEEDVPDMMPYACVDDLLDAPSSTSVTQRQTSNAWDDLDFFFLPVPPQAAPPISVPLGALASAPSTKIADSIASAMAEAKTLPRHGCDASSSSTSRSTASGHAGQCIYSEVIQVAETLGNDALFERFLAGHELPDLQRVTEKFEAISTWIAGGQQGPPPFPQSHVTPHHHETPQPISSSMTETNVMDVLEEQQGSLEDLPPELHWLADRDEVLHYLSSEHPKDLKEAMGIMAYYQLYPCLSLVMNEFDFTADPNVPQLLETSSGTAETTEDDEEEQPEADVTDEMDVIQSTIRDQPQMNAIGRMRRYLLEEAPDEVISTAATMDHYASVLWPDSRTFRLYSKIPKTLEARGVNLLNRTFMECKPDHITKALVESIYKDITKVDINVHPDWLPLAHIPIEEGKDLPVVVVDLFAGSCNLGFWFHELWHCPCYAFEKHPLVFDSAQHNLRMMSSPVALYNMDYVDGLAFLASCGLPTNTLLLFLIDPPWGNAANRETGLDLTKTIPPVSTILDNIALHFPLEVLQGRVLCEIHTFSGKYRFKPVPFNPILAWFRWAHQGALQGAPHQGYIFGCL